GNRQSPSPRVVWRGMPHCLSHTHNILWVCLFSGSFRGVPTVLKKNDGTLYRSRNYGPEALRSFERMGYTSEPVTGAALKAPDGARCIRARVARPVNPALEVGVTCVITTACGWNQTVRGRVEQPFHCLLNAPKGKTARFTWYEV